MDSIDVTMGSVAVMFAWSLIPQLKKSWSEKSVEIAWQTLLVSAFGIWVMTVCFAIMGKWLTFSANLITAMCWSTLCLMKHCFVGRT